MSAWAEQEIIELVCERKWSETADCVSFELSSPRAPIAFDFYPGQFASLGFNIEGHTEYRAYSISSAPQQSSLQFTVKRVEGGKVSAHIQDTLRPGERVQVMKPQGRFNTVDCPPRDKVLLISAGCGITPVMSMAKKWLAQGAIDIEFLHIARHWSDTIYAEELQQLAGVYPQFHLRLLLKDAAGSGYEQGRLDQQRLAGLIADLHQRSVYLCGPVGFMQDVQRYLEGLGFDMTHFYQESFTPHVSPSLAGAEQAWRVKVAAFGVDLEAPSDRVLLEALESGKLPIIAACRSGICGSCKCRVTSGQVRMQSQQTLTEQEIEQGYVLACSAVPESDVEVELC